MTDNFDIIQRKLLGVPVVDCTSAELMRYIDHCIQNSIKKIIYGVSVTFLGRIKKMPELMRFYREMDIIISDGAGIPVLGKLFGVRIREHIGLPDTVERTIALAGEKGYKVLLFGAQQEVNDRACNNILKNNPGITVCKGINGYFKEEDGERIVNDINSEAPDILLIGITAPIKERFALKYKDKLNVKIIIPCGGMIDVFAGVTKREPDAIKGLPLTWLYRFIQEPRRLFGATFVAGLYFMFCVFPVLWMKHVTGIERNPGIMA
ncbi:WecB/TagA/CpsF family glycosyltransferase [Spirochaetota bacterium]